MPSGHLDEEQLERYSLGLTPESALAEVEEHLLVCADCQDALGRIDAYVRAMRAASAKAEAEKHKLIRPFLPKLAWAGAALAGVAVLLMGSQWLHVRRMAPAEVVLASMRGPDSVFASAPANRPLMLVMASEGLQEYPRYEVEVVDGAGRQVSRGAASSSAGRITASVKALAPGRYYARLYSPPGELLREYGLETR